MFGRHLLSIFLVVAGTLSCTATAWAQTPQGERRPRDASIEATIFAIPRSSTLASLGGSMAFFWTPRLAVEGEITVGDDILTGAASLIWALPRAGRLTPFVSGGVGLEKQDFVDAVSVRDTMTPSRTRFATAFGGGATFQIHDGLSIRCDVRWINQRWRVGNGVSFRW